MAVVDRPPTLRFTVRRCQTQTVTRGSKDRRPDEEAVESQSLRSSGSQRAEHGIFPTVGRQQKTGVVGGYNLGSGSATIVSHVRMDLPNIVSCGHGADSRQVWRRPLDANPVSQPCAERRCEGCNACIPQGMAPTRQLGGSCGRCCSPTTCVPTRGGCGGRDAACCCRPCPAPFRSPVPLPPRHVSCLGFLRREFCTA